MARALTAIATVVVLLIALGFGQDLSRWLELAAVFRLHLAAPALVLGVVLSLLGRRWIGVAAVLAGGLAFASLGPFWLPSDRSGPKNGVPVRVLAANVYMGNRSLDELAGVLIAEDVDVLVTVETPLALRKRLIDAYPYVVQRQREDRAIRNAIWSRLPLTANGIIVNDNVGPLSAAAVVDLGEGARLGLIGVHFARAWEGYAEGQISGLEKLAAAIDAPLAIAGDFNAVPWQRLIAEVEAATGTAIEGGAPITWRGRYPGGLPEPLGHSIDHVLTAPGIGLRDLRTVPLPGSDHLGLSFTLIVPRGPEDDGPLSGTPGSG